MKTKEFPGLASSSPLFQSAPISHYAPINVKPQGGGGGGGGTGRPRGI